MSAKRRWTLIALALWASVATEATQAATPPSAAARLAHQLHETLRTQLDRVPPERTRAILEGLLGNRRFIPDDASEITLQKALDLIERARTTLGDPEHAAYTEERARMLRERVAGLGVTVERAAKVEQTIARTGLPLKRLLSVYNGAFAYSADGSQVVLANQNYHDAKLMISDAATGATVREMSISTPSVDVEVSPDFRYVATSQAYKQGNSFELHDLRNGKLLLDDAEQDTNPRAGAVRFLPGSGHLLNMAWERNWFVPLGSKIRKPTIQPLGPGVVALSPSAGPFARIYLDAKDQARLELRSDQTGKVLRRLPFAGSKPTVQSRATLSPDGKWLAHATGRGRLEIIDFRAGRVVARAKLDLANGPSQMTFTSDGQFIFVVGEDGDLSLHQVIRDGARVRLEASELLAFARAEWGEKAPYFLHLRLSPDGLKARLGEHRGISELDPREMP
jgi:hypothetical protein